MNGTLQTRRIGKVYCSCKVQSGMFTSSIRFSTVLFIPGRDDSTTINVVSYVDVAFFIREREGLFHSVLLPM